MTKSVSIARYLLAKVIVPSAIANVALGALGGALVFPAGRDVPLLGAVSACGDTLVASFLIGFLTMIVVAPGASMEARGGRVRGLGWSDPALRWCRAHRALSGLALGVLWLSFFGFAGVKLLQAEWAQAMPRGAFLLFKASFAGIFGVLAAIVAAFVGLAPEADVRKDPRWSHEPSTLGVAYPFDYMDKGALAVTSRERGSSGTPTWELRVEGAIHAEDVKIALGDLATRYPILTTKVQALDGVPPVARSYRYAHDVRFTVEAIFDVIDARDPGVLAAAVRERRSRFLDLYTEFPLQVTMAITGDESCRLLFRQHHAIADGRAFIGLLVDFAAFLNDARARWRPAPAALAPIGRRSELEALGLAPQTQRKYLGAGFVVSAANAIRAVTRPLTPLLQNESNDYTGDDCTVHWVVSDAVLGPWNAARKRLDVSLNTLLTGALMLANQRVHRARGHAVGRTSMQIVMETRPRDPSFVSFANHLAFLEAEAELGKVEEPSALLRALQAQIVRQRDEALPIKRLLCERWVVDVLPLEVLQKLIFETTRPSYNLNFSNLISLDFAPLEGEGWAATDVMITTPVAPRFGIVLTVIRYRGRLAFNFNYKTTAAPPALVEDVVAAFRAVLSEITGAEAETVDV